MGHYSGFIAKGRGHKIDCSRLQYVAKVKTRLGDCYKILLVSVMKVSTFAKFRCTATGLAAAKKSKIAFNRFISYLLG